MVNIYTESGKRIVFACAVAWPGWCRPGRGEEQALANLAAYADRYAPVAGAAGVPFDLGRPTALAVVERITGTATTDFGALDVAPDLDRLPTDGAELERVLALTRAAWDEFERIAISAPATLRKGPRGGGRDRDRIISHVRETEVLHARMLGIMQRPFPAQDRAAASRVRARIVAEIKAGGAASLAVDLPKSRRPPLFVARRTAWHALDHAWEIQDKS